MLTQSMEEGKLKKFKLLKEKFAAEYRKEKNRLDAKNHKQRNQSELTNSQHLNAATQQIGRAQQFTSPPKQTHRDPLAD